jgi:hypothetical protein
MTQKYTKRQLNSLKSSNNIMINNFLDRILYSAILIIKYQLALKLTSLTNFTLSKNSNKSTLPTSLKNENKSPPPSSLYFPVLCAHPTLDSSSSVRGLRSLAKPHLSENILNNIFKLSYFRANNKKRDMLAPVQLSVVYRRKLNSYERHLVDRSYCLTSVREKLLEKSLLYIPQVFFLYICMYIYVYV